VFTLARFSEAFLVLRAQNLGLAVGLIPAVMIAMNVVYAGVAYPAGVAADRFGHRTLLMVGLAMLVVADLVFAAATAPAHAFVGTAFWGLHMGLTQGLLSKLVADTAPERLRGTAFGVFYLVTGAALLLASVIAGALWNEVGPSGTFIAGAAFALLAMVGLVGYRSGTSRFRPWKPDTRRLA
jgi:MFS family permease